MSARLAVFVTASALALMVTIVGTSGAQDEDPGERLMNAACQDCHSVRVIQVQAMDAEGWMKRVSQEIDKGAKLSKEDVPTLVNYLVRTHGPLPDGPGKEVILNTCTQCHDLYRIKANRRSPEEWEELLVSMLNEGAQLNDEEFARVHAYLSRNFGIE
jgi:cytochrome c5